MSEKATILKSVYQLGKQEGKPEVFCLKEYFQYEIHKPYLNDQFFQNWLQNNSVFTLLDYFKSMILWSLNDSSLYMHPPP